MSENPMEVPAEPEVRVLVIDDEEVVCRSCVRVLGAEGYLVEDVRSGLDGLRRIDERLYDIVLVDLKMPGMGGMEVLQRVKEEHPDIDVLVITGYAAVETAIEAMKLGAFDYLCKPFTPDELVATVRRVVEKRRLLAGNHALQHELWARYRLENIVGTSRVMEEMFRRIARVAPTHATVLVRGESGVGKELVARAVHFNSLRSGKPFIAVDCGGIPETLLESELFGHAAGAFTGAAGAKRGLVDLAAGGTLFLDEIGNVPPGIQAKLLRVLQEREYRPLGEVRTLKADFRLIAATNRDLEAMVREGRFREDLFYRLNVFPIQVPPLRERKDDVPALALHLLAKCSSEAPGAGKRIAAEAMAALVAWDWPGNVRELGNVVEGAAILADDLIRPEHLPLEIRRRLPPLEGAVPTTQAELKEVKKSLRLRSVEPVERVFLLEALEHSDWNVSRAAVRVGMQRSNFQALMRKHGIRVQRGGDATGSGEEPGEPSGDASA